MSYAAFSRQHLDLVDSASDNRSGGLVSLTLGTSGAFDRPVTLASRYANRHGLITGATGSGKTCSLVRLATEFNRIGVPVFAPDMKGDLAQAIEAGIPKRANAVRLVPGVNFHLSLRRMGSDLAARALGLTDAQRGALDSVMARGFDTPSSIWTGISVCSPSATNRVLLRALDRLDPVNFDRDGFDVADLIRKPAPVSILHARDIAEQGATYAATITFLLRELYTRLPEVGDRALPVLAFFIDEAHMLFADAEPELVRELERMVRLIRSRGVSVWFVTQSPADLPETILAQLQNRIQHSLRAVTPKDWRGVRAAVDTMPPMLGVAPADLVVKLGTLPPGLAIVSLIGADGQPGETSFCRVSPAQWNPGEPTWEAPTARLASFRRPAPRVAAQPAFTATVTATVKRDPSNVWPVLNRAARMAAIAAGVTLGFGLTLFVVMLKHAAHGKAGRRH